MRTSDPACARQSANRAKAAPAAIRPRRAISVLSSLLRSEGGCLCACSSQYAQRPPIARARRAAIPVVWLAAVLAASAGVCEEAPRERAVASVLPPVEASASLGPGAEPRPPLGSAGMVPLFTVEGGAPAALTIAPAIPAAPESSLPGNCQGGPHPGTQCTVSSECGGGGTCRLFRFDVYRNEGGVGFSSPSNPRTALDDLIRAGPVPAPPARISSVELAFVVTGTGVPAGSSLRIEIRFWDDIDPAAPVGIAVESGFLGGLAFVVPGPLDPGPALFIGTVPSALAVASDDPTVGYQLDFRDNASGALAYATPFFFGEPVQIGSSADVYWRDANANGRFDASDARQFGGAPNLANFYAHLGGEAPTSETEPNGSSATATVTASCVTLAGAIDPVGDVDWYRFTVGTTQTVLTEVGCASPA